MSHPNKPLAVVTGASTGIGYELAKCCARAGFDLLIAADEPRIHAAATDIELLGAQVTSIEADLATMAGIERLVEAIGEREVEVLIANAGRGLGHAFLEQDLAQIRHVIDTNVTGTVALVHKVGREMQRRGRGRILVTGSIAGIVPGTYHAVYNATKAFIESFTNALRAELKGSDVTVTTLMPGATDTEFFARAGMLDTRVGQGRKADAASVARTGFDAMMNGEAEVVAGWQNKIMAAIATVVPASVLAESHRRSAEPGSARS